MATTTTNGSQPQYNQNVTFIGNGLPQGNKNLQPSLTAEVSKINESAAVNQPNNMVAGSNQNTIHGEENNALQGGQPGNAARSFPLAAMAGSNATMSTNNTLSSCCSGCTRPYFVFEGGSIKLSPRCDCYVSTGIDVLEIVSSVYTFGAAAGAIKFFKGAKRISSVSEAARKASRHLQKISEIKKDIISNRRFGDTAKRYYQRVLSDAGFPVELKDITAEDLQNFKRDVLRLLEKEKAGVAELYKKATDAGYKGKNGFNKLLQDKKANEMLAFFSVFSGMGSAAVWIMGALDYLDFAIYRPKECTAPNRLTLNDACNCECDAGTSDANECYNSAFNAFVGKTFRSILQFFPLLTLGNYASPDEYIGCSEDCECLGLNRTVDPCNCFCNPNEFGFTQRLREHYGRHPDAATDCPFEQSLNTSSCCCECDSSTEIGQGIQITNYHIRSNNGYPSTHYLYEEGCHLTCGGESNGLPCGDGYVFNNDVSVCSCEKICKPGSKTVALRWTKSGAGPNQWLGLYHDCDSWLQVPNYPVSAGATDIYDGSPANYEYGTVICEPCQSSSYVQNTDNQDMIP